MYSKLSEFLYLCEPEPCEIEQGSITGRALAPRITVSSTSQSQLRFVSSSDNNVIDIEQDSQVLYKLVKAPKRWHCWELVDVSEQEVVAKLRASRTFSWLALLNPDGEEVNIKQKLSLGFGKIEWKVRKRELMRWCRINHSMVYVRESEVVMPEAAKMVINYTRFSCKSPCAVDFQILLNHHQHQLQTDLPAIVATAFITTWKWSREPEFVKAIRSGARKCCVEWLAQHLQLDHLATILSESLRRDLPCRSPDPPELPPGRTSLVCAYPL